MKKFSQTDVAMKAYRASKKCLLLVCGMILISSLSQAQLIRSAEKKGITSEVTTGRDDEEAYKISSEDDLEDSQKNKLVNNRYGYFATDQFVFDNLIKLKKIYRIPDIYFQLDQSIICKESHIVLDSLAALFMDEPYLHVAITSYCDSRNLGYNTILSLCRAQAAKDYLIKRGISADRIVIEKHGRPGMINPCIGNPGCTLEEQRINRRTEFNVIYNNVNLAHMHAYEEEY